MVKIPINSLQDLLLHREMQNRADPFRSGMQALADGVARGIEQGREEQKAKKDKAERNAAAWEGFNTGTTGAVNIEKKMSMDKDGNWSLTATSESDSARATRIKTERENKLAEGYADAVRSGADSVEIAKNFPEFAKEIKDLEELGVISPPQVQEPVKTVSSDGRISMGTPSSELGISGIMDSIVTEKTPQGRPKTVISRSGKIEEGKIKTIQKIQETQTEEAVKSIRSFNRVKSASQGIVSAAKRIVKEQGGLGAVHQITGKVKRAAAKTGLFNVSPEQAQAGQAELRGQLRETVLSLSPILTNQNRIIQGVIDMLAETLPKPGEATTGTEFTAQLRQTVKNAYKLSKALNAGALSASEISDLNSASPEEVKRQFKKILGKSSWTDQDENDFMEEWEEIISVPATVPEDIFSKNGGTRGSIANKYGL